MRPLTAARTGALATALLLALASQALGNRLRFSNQGIRATYSTFAFSTLATEGPGAICPVTLEGTLHSSTIVKTAESLIGYVTRANLQRNECVFVGGATHIWFLNGVERDLNNNVVAQSLPWHIRYETFTGALPLIEEVRIRVIPFSFLFLVAGSSCLYASTVASPARFAIVRNGAGTISPLRAIQAAAIPRSTGSALLCPASANLIGEGEIRLLGTTNTISLVLI